MARQKLSFYEKTGPVRLDLLPTNPSNIPFLDQVKNLNLSPALESKLESFDSRIGLTDNVPEHRPLHLTKENEQELATEVLLYRHRFTELVVSHPRFRQAALSIIQNIYLFQNRKIFFGTSGTGSEVERQRALSFLTQTSPPQSVPLAKTFQHLIIARIWNRLISQQDEKTKRDPEFIKLHGIVGSLNTIRNIYMLLSSKLVGSLAGRINDIYKSSINYEDAVQIGSIGVARAAYRYHQSIGVRFSTYAAKWIFKEIQRQALNGRLIKISAHSLDKYSRAAKTNDKRNLELFSKRIDTATVSFSSHDQNQSLICPWDNTKVEENVELQELSELLLENIDQILSEKSADIIKRRYGFPPYTGMEQSIISISETYGVTRSSIYQIENTALKKLRKRLQPMLS